MKRYKLYINWVIVLLFLLNSFLFPKITLANDKENIESSISDSCEKQIIVKFRESKYGISSKKAFSSQKRKLNIQYKKSIKHSNIEIYSIRSQTDVEQVLKDLRSNPEIDYAEPDYTYKAADINSGSRFSEQWALKNNGQYMGAHYGVPGVDINYSTVWASTYVSNDIVVGLIDSGVDIIHPDLNDNIFKNKNEIPNNNIDDDSNGFIDDINGWDIINNDNNVYDSVFGDLHGTHIAGILAAENNNYGVNGVASNVKILPLKVMTDDGYCQISDIIEAIKYSKDMGVKIINCSWSGSSYSRILEEEMKNSEILYVCAAGNDGHDIDEKPEYPTCFDIPNIISVGAIDNRGNLAKFSNYGSKVDIVAPGNFILSTYPEGKYGYLNGTSMAAPFVTGAVALLKSYKGNLTNKEIIDKIKSNVTKLDLLEEKVNTGLVNISKVLCNIEGIVTATPTSTNTTTPTNTSTITPTNTPTSTPTSTPTNTPFYNNKVKAISV